MCVCVCGIAGVFAARTQCRREGFLAGGDVGGLLFGGRDPQVPR